MVDLHSKTKLMNKLYNVFSVPLDKQVDHKGVERDIRAIFSKESKPKRRELCVPEHLVCIISGELMSDPVTLDSGRTYERSQIEKLFAMYKEFGQPCQCPVNMTDVDPDVMIPNYGLKKEAERLLKENPWAFEFDPRTDYKKIKIWK